MNGPGSEGTDNRIHAVVRLHDLRIRDVRVDRGALPLYADARLSPARCVEAYGLHWASRTAIQKVEVSLALPSLAKLP